MPRRKELKISLSQLKNGEYIFNAIKDDALVEGYDLSTLTISVKGNIKPVIKDAAHAVKSMEHYLKANPNCCTYFDDIPYVTKYQLARMAGISRSTLNKWLNDKLIVPMKIGGDYGLNVFNPFHILSQLKEHKNNNATQIPK